MRKPGNYVTIPIDHIPTPVKLHGMRQAGFRRQKRTYEPMPQDRIIGSDQASYMEGKELRTLLLTISDSDSNIVIDTHDELAPIALFLEHLSKLNDGALMEPIKKLAWVKQRVPRQRTDEKYKKSKPFRDGRRQTVTPTLLVFHDLESFLGRVFRQYPQFKRTVRAGEDNIKIQLPYGWELEIAKHILGGSGCSAEFYAYKDRKVMRLFLFSLTGYLDYNPEINAKGFLGDEVVIEPLPEEWKNRQIDSFTDGELNSIRKNALDRGSTARNIYIKLSDMLTGISPKVTRRYGPKGNYGILPNSVAGAAAKMAFSMAEQDEWPAPSYRVTQIGASTYMGGYQFFNHEFYGYNDNLYLIDGVSWHGHTMCQPPDPATCEYIDIAPGPFDINDWRGKFGSMLISGTVTNGRYTPLRIHDPATKRLKYINGDFTRQWLSIPEIVMAVVSGRLKVAYIHDGIWIDGSNEYSFLRKFALRMYNIKDNSASGSPMYQLSKKLIVSLAGKLAEVNRKIPWVSPVARRELVPKRLNRQQQHELLNAYISNNNDLAAKADELLSEMKDPTATAPWGNIIDRMVHSGATTGAYYLPLHAAQIWGMAAGMLSLAAYCTHAISGYTDSLITRGDPGEGLARYRELMADAGYEAPENGMGSFKYKVRNGYGYLLKAPLWIIRYHGYTDTTTGEVIPDGHEQALGTFYNPAEGEKWEELKELSENKEYYYRTESKPYTLKQSYIEGVEPGTLMSQDRKVSLQPKSEGTEQGTIELAKARIRRANNTVASESSQDVPTTQTAQGCIKILTRYGLSLRDISDSKSISYNMVKLISSGRKPGLKHLPVLQELVAEIEQNMVQDREPEPVQEPETEQSAVQQEPDIKNISTTTLRRMVNNNTLPKSLIRLASDELLLREDSP